MLAAASLIWFYKDRKLFAVILKSMILLKELQEGIKAMSKKLKMTEFNSIGCDIVFSANLFSTVLLFSLSSSRDFHATYLLRR